jgi:orotate phosphoribosyltransferase
VLEVCRTHPYFSDEALAEVRRFLDDPVSWSRARGGIGSAAEAQATEQA